MGRLALGAVRWSLVGASVVLLGAANAWAQVPAAGSRPAPQRPPAAEALPPQPPPPPASEPAPAPAKPPAAAPTPPPAAAPAPAPAPPPPPEPPLDLPKNDGPPKRPAFLHTREEMESIKPSRSPREAPAPQPVASTSKAVPKDFAVRASPWVDFTLTSFYMEDRAGNFLNLGVQVGGYLWERLRVAGRVVVPLEDVSDDLSHYSTGTNSTGNGSFTRVDARSMAALYGASVGLLITNSKTFVFGPSIELQRTDVGAYGNAIAFGLPFEWTTQRNMRIGFELAIGHAFGGTSLERCTTFTAPATSCGERTVDRGSGTTVLFQYNMGWSLGGL